MPKGLPRNGMNKGWFKKKKRPSPKTEFKKGVVSWNKGKKNLWKHTDEWKQKMSRRMKGHPSYCTDEGNKKISIAHKGKKHTEEHRRKISEALKGEKSYRWRGGVTLKQEKIRRNIEFRLWREAVFARDNWTCQECGDNKGHNLNAHHIKSFSKYPELRIALDNGIALCKTCHIKIHKKEVM
jgi:hypothetical protein